MDRRKLQRQLRRVQRLARYLASVEQRLKALCSTLQVTDEELRYLVDHNDGYLVVVEARDRNSHVTLSGADEAARKAAHDRAKARDDAKRKAAEERKKQVQAEREEAKRTKVSRKAQRLLDMAAEMKAMGLNPLLVGPVGQETEAQA